MINKITYTFFLFFFLFLCGAINAQDLKVIDNKGTIKSINKVTYGTVVPTATNPPEKLKGDIYIKGTTALGSTTTPEETYLFDGTTWMKIGSNSHTGTTGSIFFADTDGTPTENNAHFFWDEVNERLNIGNVLAGTNKLTVNGAIRSKAFNNANGTVGLPSYRFSSDSDTGMWRGSLANHLRFSTKGIEALTINALQNIGIGVNIPTQKLDVNGKLRVRTITEETALTATDRIPFVTTDGVLKKITAENLGNAAFWTLKGNSGTDPAINFLGTTDNKPLIIRTGYGSTNQERLKVRKSSQPHQGQVLINQASIPTSSILSALCVKASNTYLLTFEDREGNDFMDTRFYLNGDLSIGNRGASAYTLKLNKKFGNVGIGINPTEKLHVDGKVRINTLLVGATSDKIVVADTNGVLNTYNGPKIIASGRGRGTWSSSSGYSVVTIGSSYQSVITSAGRGEFIVTLPSSSSMSNFSISLSVKDPEGNSNTFVISYDDITQYGNNNLNTFKIRIQHTSGGNRNSEFMYTVYGW